MTQPKYAFISLYAWADLHMAAKDFSQVPGDVYQLPTDSQNSDASPNPPVPPSPAQGLLGSHALYSAAPLNSSSSMTF